MADARVEQVREVIIGMRPVYTDTGNATELWLPSGEVLVDRRGVKAETQETQGDGSAVSF